MQTTDTIETVGWPRNIMRAHTCNLTRDTRRRRRLLMNINRSRAADPGSPEMTIILFRVSFSRVQIRRERDTLTTLVLITASNRVYNARVRPNTTVLNTRPCNNLCNNNDRSRRRKRLNSLLNSTIWLSRLIVNNY